MARVGSAHLADELAPAADHCEKPFVPTATQITKPYGECWGTSFNPFAAPDDPAYFAVTCGTEVTVYRVAEDPKRGFTAVASFSDRSLQLPSHPHYNQLTARSKEGVTYKPALFFTVTWCLVPDAEPDENNKTVGQLLLVFAGAHGFICVVDVGTHKTSMVHQGHTADVNDLRTNPINSQIYLSASKDLTVRLWNVAFPTALAVFGNTEAHHEQILSADWHGSERWMVAGGMDHCVTLWEIPQEVRDRIETTSMADFDISSTPKLENPVPSFYGKLNYEYDIPVQVSNVAYMLELHRNYVDCVRFFGDFIISRASDERVYVWKFGDFTEGVEGGARNLPTGTWEKNISLLSEMKLSDKSSAECGGLWFFKFCIDPLERWLIIPHETQLIMWSMGPKTPPNGQSTGKAHSSQKIVIDISNKSLRQVTMDPHGRFMVAVGDDGSITRLDRVLAGQKPPPLRRKFPTKYIPMRCVLSDKGGWKPEYLKPTIEEQKKAMKR